MMKRTQSSFFVGIFSTYTWSALALFDVRQRYRRSFIGPWWFTINVALLIGIMALVYGQVLQQPINEYLPFLAIGLVIWQFISTTLSEACSCFIGSTHLIKQVRLPMVVYVCRLVFRNFLIFTHALPVLLLLLLISRPQIGWPALSVPFAIFMFLLHAVWLSTLISFLCARFRDMIPITANIIQILFFTTPIVWRADMLGTKSWIANFNPLHHIIECVRSPLIGGMFPVDSWLVSIAILPLGLIVSVWMVDRYSHRVPYWV